MKPVVENKRLELNFPATDLFPLFLPERGVGASLQPVKQIIPILRDEIWINALNAELMLLLLVVTCGLHLARDTEEERDGKPGEVLEGVGCEGFEGRRRRFADFATAA